MKKLFLTLLILLILSCLSLARTVAAEEGRGVMKVDYLYSLEFTGGRGEKLQEPEDIFYDRKKDEFYIVEGAKNSVYVYDGNGMFIQEIKLGQNRDVPGHLAVDGEGRIYVTFLHSAKVKIMDYRGEPLNEFFLPGMIDAPGATLRPTHLATGANGEVYALKSVGGIVRIDPKGTAHKEIDIAGEGQPNVISGMTVDSTGRFLFTDMRPYSVVALDPQKREFNRFGVSGVLYGQLARPAGVATDGAGHIFITNLTTTKVSCLDRNGNFLEEFGEYGDGAGYFYMPGKIVSDGKDRLFVLENALKRVQVFKVEFLNEKKKEVMNGPAS